MLQYEKLFQLMPQPLQAAMDVYQETYLDVKRDRKLEWLRSVG